MSSSRGAIPNYRKFIDKHALSTLWFLVVLFLTQKFEVFRVSLVSYCFTQESCLIAVGQLATLQIEPLILTQQWLHLVKYLKTPTTEVKMPKRISVPDSMRLRTRSIGSSHNIEELRRKFKITELI